MTLSPIPQVAPVGTIVAFAGQVLEEAATGWLVCNGAELSRTQYNELFAAIGTNFGSLTPNTFNVPDLRGVFLRGVDPAGGPKRDPDGDSRQALRPHGNNGRAVGSWQTYGTAPARTPFRNAIRFARISNANVDTECGNGTAARYSSNETSVDQMPLGGDLETRPVNRYVYFLIKFRMYGREQTLIELPVGAVVPFAGTNTSALGAQWKRCDGSAVKPTDYPRLTSVVQYAHGKTTAGDLVLPDYRGTFLRGVDDGKGTQPYDPDATRREPPYPQGSEGNKGNSGDRVGSVQSYATAHPIKALRTKFTNIPNEDTSVIKGVIRAIGNWTGAEFAQLTRATDGGGDAESRPTNVSVEWYVRVS